MNEQATFEIESSGLARISGSLTLDTVTSVFNQASEAGKAGKHIGVLDLSSVSHVDSSGLALVLEWQSQAKLEGRSMSISNAPRDLLSLAKLCEADELLSIAGRQEQAAQAMLT